METLPPADARLVPPPKPFCAQELKEEYFAHLLRPGTPSKTFRIRVFAFAASEEPLTPHEILEAQFFAADGGGGGQHKQPGANHRG